MMSKPSSAPPLAVLLHEAVHGAAEVLGVDHADDVLRLAAEDRDAGVRRVDRLREDGVGRRLGVDHLDVAPVHHHLLDLPLAEVERAEQPVALLGSPTAPSEWCSAIAAGDLELAPTAGGAFGSVVARRTSRSTSRANARTAVTAGDEQRHQEADRPGDPERRRLGAGDRAGLRHHLGEDQHQRRHRHGGDRDAAVAEQPGEEQRWRATAARTLARVLPSRIAPTSRSLSSVSASAPGRAALAAVGHGRAAGRGSRW